MGGRQRRASPQGWKASVGYCLLLATPAGALGWIWTGNWRWAATGLVLFLPGVVMLALAAGGTTAGER